MSISNVTRLLPLADRPDMFSLHKVRRSSFDVHGTDDEVQERKSPALPSLTDWFIATAKGSTRGANNLVFQIGVNFWVEQHRVSCCRRESILKD